MSLWSGAVQAERMARQVSIAVMVERGFMCPFLRVFLKAERMKGFWFLCVFRAEAPQWPWFFLNSPVPDGALDTAFWFVRQRLRFLFI